MRILVLIMLAMFTLAAAGCTGPRIAVVDSERVLNESVLALSFQKLLAERERAMAEDLRLLGGQLSAQELEARRQSHIRNLQQVKLELEQRLSNRVREVVAEVAKERRLRLVLVKDATPYGGLDVTADVIAKLK